jgi:hypothetical protein
VIVDTNAYVLSLIEVFICCLIRDFLLPLVVWRKYLKDKSYSYRFWFCVITQAALLINLVLLLGFLDICNRYTIMGSLACIYALIAWNFSDKKFFLRAGERANELWSAYKEEGRFFDYIKQSVTDWLRKCGRVIYHLPVWRYLRKHWLEAGVLAALVIYNIWFLTYNVMRYHSYQFSDIPTHQSWIYALEHGSLFPEGIYPFGMHSMVYMIRIIFGLNLREILLYAGAYQTVLLVIGMYLLAKEIFHAKYTPIAVVIIFSFMLNQGRYGASLPQEAGMYAVFGLAYFMLRYLHEDRKKLVIQSDSRLRRLFRINPYISRRYIRSEAVLLMLCVALVIAYHFYTAIAAVLLVLAIGLAYLPRILKKQYFIPLLFCGSLGAVIAVLPFAACLAKGTGFQESMQWATTVLAGEEWKGSDTDYLSKLQEAQSQGDTDDSDTNTEPSSSDEQKAKVDYSAMTWGERLKYYYDAIFYFGSMAMFGDDATVLMFLCMLTGFVCGLLMLPGRRTRCYGRDYHALIINMMFLCTVGAAASLGIPEAIAAARASTFAEPYIGIILMLPVDFVFRLLGVWKNRYYQRLLGALSAAVCAGAALAIVSLGWYHHFFDVNLAYYNESVYALRHIKESYKDFTVVSPTEEYYDVLDYGYHTQLSELMDMVNGKQAEFTIPSKYVFFFIEKRVLEDITYGQTDVSLKYAAMNFIYTGDTQDYYYQRAVLESQAYYWAQKMKEMYPRSFKVYYEDDIYVVYLLEQNTYSPYSLRIDYLSDYADEIEANGWKDEN